MSVFGEIPEKRKDSARIRKNTKQGKNVRNEKIQRTDQIQKNPKEAENKLRKLEIRGNSKESGIRKNPNPKEY